MPNFKKIAQLLTRRVESLSNTVRKNAEEYTNRCAAHEIEIKEYVSKINELSEKNFFLQERYKDTSKELKDLKCLHFETNAKAYDKIISSSKLNSDNKTGLGLDKNPKGA